MSEHKEDSIDVELPPGQTMLTEVPLSHKFLQLPVRDLNSTGIMGFTTNAFRPLTLNEVLVLGLNEAAAATGRGFYYHTRNGGQLPGEMDIPSRAEVTIAGSPQIVFMDFGWSEGGSLVFENMSHQDRLLFSDILLNNPGSDCPLYGVHIATETVSIADKSVSDLFLSLRDDRFQLLCIRQHRGDQGVQAFREPVWTPTAHRAEGPLLVPVSETQSVPQAPSATNVFASFEPSDIASLHALFMQEFDTNEQLTPFDGSWYLKVYPRPTGPAMGLPLE